MAIKFQYNKTSLNELNKQLKTRTRALPTLKSKESALRLEVKKAKKHSESLVAQLETELKSYEYTFQHPVPAEIHSKSGRIDLAERLERD